MTTWQSPYEYDKRFRELTHGYYICVDHSYRGSVPGPDCDQHMCVVQEVFFEKAVFFRVDVYGELQR